MPDNAKPVALITGGGRGMGDQIVGQFLCHLRGEKTRMRIGQRVELRTHRRQHLRVQMPQAGHRRAARGVDILPPGGIADHGALAARGDRIAMVDLAMKNMGHARDWHS